MTANAQVPVSSARGPGAIHPRAAGTAVAGMLAATIMLLQPWSTFVPTARAAEPLTIRRVELPVDVPPGPLAAVIVGGPGYIAVGGSLTDDAEGGLPVILTSADGTAWNRASLTGSAARGMISDIVAFPGGYAAVGGDTIAGRDTGVVWLSDDGLAWRRTEIEGSSSPGALSSVTRWRDGLYAIGCTSHEPEMCSVDSGWISPDGETWSFLGRVGKGEAVFESVEAGFKRLVVVGTTGVYGTGLVAKSADGRRWSQHAVDSMSTLTSVEILANGIAAIGTQYATDPDADPDAAGSGGIRVGLVLYSPDRGRTWLQLPATAPSGSTFSGLSIGTLTIAYGSSPTGQPAAWLTHLGVDWRALPADESMGADPGRIADMAPFIDGLGGVAVGRLGPGYYDDLPAIWVIRP